MDVHDKHVEVVFGAEGQVWVNVDGVCAFRSQGGTVVIDDRRQQHVDCVCPDVPCPVHSGKYKSDAAKPFGRG